MTRTLALNALVVVILSAAVAAAVWYYPSSAADSIPPDTRPGNTPASAVPVTLPGTPSPAVVKLPSGIDLKFQEITRSAGIDFMHYDGRTEMEYIMDQTGSGVAWLDYDQDGLMDLFLVQGGTFVAPHPKTPPRCKLFKNLGGGKFKDVSNQVGLEEVGCGQGVAVGDIDNDGFPEIFVTYYGRPNVLYHNQSDGKGGRHFVNITAKAGLAEHPDWRSRPNFSTSAAFLDYDNDGKLDLFVCSYVKIDLNHYPECTNIKATRRGPCPPSKFEPTHCVLYRNNGDGTFTDVSEQAGIKQVSGKALGVVALDLDDDGLVDIVVANDTVPNFFFRNLGKGRFEACGPMCGCLVNRDGTPQAYMGIDADDLNGDGRPDLFMTAFARETNSFFRNEGRGQFLDATQATGLGPPSWPMLGFGTLMLDLDRDGGLDLLVANGHVSRFIDDEGDPEITFKQKAQLFLNDGRGRFREITDIAGDYFQKERHVGRGVAAADFDNDGHMDLAFNNSGEPAVLLRNVSKTPYHWLRLELQGTRSNRDAVGARVIVHMANKKIVRHRKGGASYLSASDPRLLVGLGAAARVDKVEIRWPSGLEQQVGPLEVDHGYRIREGDAKVEQRP